MKQLSKYIPFRPMPYHGELFKGYIIRLASRNGRDELKDFVSAFDIGINCQSIFIAGSERHDEFLRVLAPSMDIDKKVLEAFFDGEKSVQMMDWLSVRRTVVRRPSLCPSCVAKNGYLKAEWHLYYATHCREHECKLWTTCPRCAKEFTWHGSLLQGCTSCYLQWKDVSPVKARLPASQQAIAKAQGKKKEVLIEAILQNLKVSLRPYDASILKPRDLDLYVDDMTSHIEHAYQLATSHDAIEELKLARQNHWQSKVGDGNFALFKELDAANEPIFDELKSQSNQKFDKATEVKEASHMILSPHRRLNAKPDKASLELSWKQLESVLKIGKPYITKLIKEGVMPGRMHINSPQKVSPSRMDDLVQFYKVVKKHSLPLEAANDDMIAWGDDKALSKHKVKTIDLAKCIMSKKVDVFSPKDADHLFDNFYFSVADLNKRFGQDAANTSLGDQPDTKSA